VTRRARLGRPPALTPEQDREIFEKVQLRRQLTNARLAHDYGVSVDAIYFSVARSRRARQHAVNAITGIDQRATRQLIAGLRKSM
jgi:hypothetical protein